MESFNQSKLFIKKTFTFKEDGLDVYTKDLDGEFSFFISFDDIEPQKKNRLFTENKNSITTYGQVFSIIAIISVFMLNVSNAQKIIIAFVVLFFFTALTFLIYFLIRTKYLLIELETDSQIFIILNSPNKKSMNEFIDELYLRRKKYFRESYFRINYGGTKEQEISRMKWLKSENIITKSEYEVVIDEINESLNN